MSATRLVVAGMLLACCWFGLTGCRDESDSGPDSGGKSEMAAKGALIAEEEISIADVKLFPIGVDHSRDLSNYSKWGYIDRSGKMVIEPQFSHALPFYGNRALILDKDGKNGVIDESGHVILVPQYYFIHSYSEGLAAVFVGGKRAIDDSRWGYIDESGKLAIPGPFLKAESFSEGLASVLVAQGPDVDDARWGFIDKSGQIAIRPQYEYARSFSEGLAAVVGDDGLYGFIDTSGKMVIEPRLTCDHPFYVPPIFSEGLAVTIKEGKADEWPKFGFIDKTGTFAIDAKFGAAGPFSDGLAVAKITQPYALKPDFGYIDRTGQWLIPAQYLRAYSFSEGRAVVQVGGAYPEQPLSYIDRGGARITPDEFFIAQPFRGGLAQVEIQVDDKRYMGYIDRQGRYVVDPWKLAGVPECDPRRAPQRPSADTSPKNSAQEASEVSLVKAKTARCWHNLRAISGTEWRPESDRTVTVETLLEEGSIHEGHLQCPHHEDRRRDYFFLFDEWADSEQLVACDLKPHAADDNSRSVLYAGGEAKALTAAEFARELAKPVNKSFAEAFRKAGGKM